jgi:3-oxoadipate enol-lactonase
MPHLKVNDISMYYEIHGEGEPLVLISGFSCDHTQWMSVANHLKQKYQIILFDNRGAGQTDVPEGPYTIEQMSDDVAALCEKLNINRAHFAGNSMGGFIVQSLAVRHESLVKSFIISNSAQNAQFPFRFYLEAQLQLFKANVSLKSLIAASTSWTCSYRFLATPGVQDLIIKLSLENPFPFTVEGYKGQFAALDEFDSTDWLHRASAPALIIGSDQDIVFNESAVRVLADIIPQAKYYSFKECGHVPIMEYPLEVADLMATFIEEVKVTV